MSNSARVGLYEISLEQRGIRLSRTVGDSPVVVRPFLSFSLQESGRGPVPFIFTRLTPLPGGGFQASGSTPDDTQLEVRLRPSESVDGVRVDLQMINPSRQMEARLSTKLALTGEAEPRWLVPGFFYGDNRPPGCTRAYPTFSEVHRDPRRLLSNYWAFRADRTALPLVCAWTYGCFAWISTDEVFGVSNVTPDGIGQTGLHLGVEDGQPIFGAEFPYREAPAKFSFCHDDKTEPEEVFLFIPESAPLHATFQIGLAAPDLHAYAPLMRGLHAELSETHPQHGAGPGTQYAEHAAHFGLLRWHYDGRSGAIYEHSSFTRLLGKRRGPDEPPIMHVGWLSGALPAYTLLRAGREASHPESITSGIAVFNRFTSQLSPAGTLFPVWAEDTGWACSFGPEEGTAHSRTVAEGVFFLLKAIAVEMRHNVAHQQWFDAAVSSLNFAIGTQRDDGALPCYFDLATGRATNYEGCGGLPWIAALALGSTLLQRPHYRDVAVRAGEYYTNFVTRENLYGNVEDQHLVTTSDDAHWAVIAYLALYEADRSAKWLALARMAADLALTWRRAFNGRFTPDSMLGRYGVQTRGGDISSVATPTLGFTGLVSYAEFLKLTAFTGDPYYEERAEEARYFATHLVAREDGHMNARAGMVVGNFHHTDWLQPKGLIQPLSSAMGAALVKYAGLVASNIELSRASLAPYTPEELRAASGLQPVLYAEVALRDDHSMAGVSNASQFEGTASTFGSLLGLTPKAAPGTRGLPPAGGALGQVPAASPALPPGGSGPVRRPASRELNRQPSQFEEKILPGLASPPGPMRDPLAPAASAAPPSRQPTSAPSSELTRALTNAIGSSLGLDLSTPPSRTSMPRLPVVDEDYPAAPPPAPPVTPPSPLPFNTPRPSSESSRESRGSGDDVEIKYKIF